MPSYADLELDFYKSFGYTGSLDDLEFQFYSDRSGLTPKWSYSVADHMRAYFIGAVGLTPLTAAKLSNADLERMYLDKMGFPGSSLTDDWMQFFSMGKLLKSATLFYDAGQPLRGTGYQSKNLLTYNQATVEVDTTGLAAGTGCSSIIRDTTTSRSGSASLAGTVNATSSACIFGQIGGPAGIPITPGKVYTFTLSHKGPRNCLITARINWYNITGSNASTPNNPATPINVIANEWTDFVFSATAPADAAYAAVVCYVYAASAVAGEIHNIDQLGIFEGAVTQWEPPPTPARVPNLGSGGIDLDALYGTTDVADTNDPLWLDWKGVNYLYLPGVGGNNVYVADADVAQTNELDIRVRVSLDDWTPAALSYFAAKWVSVGNQRSWAFGIQPNGALSLYMSVDGTNTIVANSTIVNTFADGETIWLRANLDGNNGNSGYDVRFYTSPDGHMWTPLGALVSGAGLIRLFDSTADISIGSSAGGSVIAGKIYEVIIRDRINGTTVLDIDTAVVKGNSTTFLARSGQTVTIERPATGRKVVSVVTPCWLLGTDDVFMIPHNAKLNIGISDSFTVIGAVRQWATQAPSGILTKKADFAASAPGWALGIEADYNKLFVSDGGTLNASYGARVLGDISVYTAVRDKSAGKLRGYHNNTVLAENDDFTDSLINSEPGYIGRSNEWGIGNFEAFGFLFFRRVLTEEEITAVTNYFLGKAG